MRIRVDKSVRLLHVSMVISIIAFLLNSRAYCQPTVNSVSNLTFGTVVSGGGTYSVSLGSSGEGCISLYGKKGATVYVTLVPPANITSGANNVPYTWSAAYNGSSNTPASATPFSGTTANFKLNAPVSGTTYAAYVYFYGSANLSAVTPAGSYSGTFSLSASYKAGGSPSNSGSITVGATVIQGLTFSASGPLDYGTVVAGTVPNVISPQTSGSAVSITITGNGGQAVTITYPASVSMTSSSNSITFVPNLSGYTSSNQTLSSSVASGSIVNLSGSTGSTGYYYLWLGGSLNAIPSNITSGTYTGTFTLSATY